jgi:hypothetical protein
VIPIALTVELLVMWLGIVKWFKLVLCIEMLIELPLSEYIAPICAAQIEGQAFSVYLIDLLKCMLGRGALLLLSLC